MSFKLNVYFTSLFSFITAIKKQLSWVLSLKISHTCLVKPILKSGITDLEAYYKPVLKIMDVVM